MRRFVVIGRDQCRDQPRLLDLVDFKPGRDSAEVDEDDPNLVEILLLVPKVIWGTEYRTDEPWDPTIRGFRRIVSNISSR